MPIDLAHKMISVAAAAAADGGAAVLDLARTYLNEVVTFDAGEVVLRRDSSLERRLLAGAAPGLAATDLLEHLSHRSHVFRFDELHELAGLPGTQAAMKERGLRSLLALPVATGGVALGAVVLGAGKPYAFVGVSQRTFGPLMAMVGVSLLKAIALSETANERPVQQDTDHSTCQGQVAKLQADLARTRDLLEGRQAELEQAHARQQVQSGLLTRERDALRARLAGVAEELLGERQALAAVRAERDRLALELGAAHRAPGEFALAVEAVSSASQPDEPSDAAPTAVEQASPQSPPAAITSVEASGPVDSSPLPGGAAGTVPPRTVRSRKKHRRR
jgi:hypothetical protein